MFKEHTKRPFDSTSGLHAHTETKPAALLSSWLQQGSSRQRPAHLIPTVGRSCMMWSADGCISVKRPDCQADGLRAIDLLLDQKWTPFLRVRADDREEVAHYVSSEFSSGIHRSMLSQAKTMGSTLDWRVQDHTGLHDVKRV
jgi:hypothetical protein